MSAISTRYLSAIHPPGPFAVVTVQSPDGSLSVPDCAAQIDSAADRTVIPQSVIDRLGIMPVRQIPLLGFGGVPTTYSVYEVRVVLPTFMPVTVEAVGEANEPWVLLGRDVLNGYKITLDGPSLKLTIEGP